MDDVGIHIVEDMSKAANPSDNNAAADEILETSAEHVPAGENQGSSLHSSGLSQDISFLRKTVRVIAKILLVLMAFFIYSPINIVIGPVWLSLLAENSMWMSKGPKVKGIYEKVFLFKSLNEKMQRYSMVNIARLGCLALTWLVITLQVPSLKSKMVFGSLLWKWSLFGAVILYGYPCALFAFSSSILIPAIVFDPWISHDKAYFWTGLFTSVSLLIYSTSVLVIWLAFFNTERGLKQNQETLYKYVAWTLISFLVGAILGMVKALVVLHWREKALYRRFKPRILMAGFQLYFLCIIVSEFARLSLLPWRYRRLMFEDVPELIKDERQTHMTADKKRRSIQDYFLTTRISLLQLSLIADKLASLAQVLREDDGVAEVEQICSEKIKGQVIDEKYIVGLIKQLYEDDAEKETWSSRYKKKLVDFIFLPKTMLQRWGPGDEEHKQRKLIDIAERKDKFMREILGLGRPGTPKKKTLGDHVSDKFMDDGASLLLEEVKALQSSDNNNITDEMLRKWMADAHKDCLSLGYTLVDAMAVVNVLDWKSTTGIVFFLGECPITWVSQKQRVVALSSCEAEYVDATRGTCQGIWLARLLESLSGETKAKALLKIDNKSAVALAKNLVFHDRSKHIDTRYHFMRDSVKHGPVELGYIKTEVQLADILTKPLAKGRFVELRDRIGVK